MKEYELSFEFFGKYMKTRVDASSAIEAKKIVMERLHFIDVTVIEPNLDFSNGNDVFSNLWNIVNGK